ncbi:MAG TPA: hypothetical protein ENI69_06305 [Rhodospirillales bacterium]|nr:hypothetical protein [Rhodospirillales bacterium]
MEDLPPYPMRSTRSRPSGLTDYGLSVQIPANVETVHERITWRKSRTHGKFILINVILGLVKKNPKEFTIGKKLRLAGQTT